MTEDERDALYARVFATPDGTALIEDLRARDTSGVDIATVEERIGRAQGKTQ